MSIRVEGAMSVATPEQKVTELKKALKIKNPSLMVQHCIECLLRDILKTPAGRQVIEDGERLDRSFDRVVVLRNRAVGDMLGVFSFFKLNENSDLLYVLCKRFESPFEDGYILKTAPASMLERLAIKIIQRFDGPSIFTLLSKVMALPHAKEIPGEQLALDEKNQAQYCGLRRLLVATLERIQEGQDQIAQLLLEHPNALPYPILPLETLRYLVDEACHLGGPSWLATAIVIEQYVRRFA